MPIRKIQKLVRAVEIRSRRKLAKVSRVIDRQLIVPPRPRSRHAISYAYTRGASSGIESARAGGGYWGQRRIPRSGYIDVKAVVQQLAAALPDQTTVAAQYGWPRVAALPALVIGLAGLLARLLVLSGRDPCSQRQRREYTIIQYQPLPIQYSQELFRFSESDARAGALSSCNCLHCYHRHVCDSTPST
jgi:hypothetical protein